LIFSDKDLHAFILEDRKENKMGTYDSDDEKPNCKFCKQEGHCIRDYVLFKEWLEKKGIHGFN
jgi:hypothetical protein